MSAEKPEHFIESETRPDLSIDLDAKIGDLTPAQVQSILASLNPSGNIIAAAPVAVAVVLGVAGGGKLLKDDKDSTDEKRDKDAKDRKDGKDGKDEPDRKDAADQKLAKDRKEDKDRKEPKDNKDNKDTDDRKNTKDETDNKSVKDATDTKAEADAKQSRDAKAEAESKERYDAKPGKDAKDVRDTSTPGVDQLLASIVEQGSIGDASSMTLRDLLTKLGLGIVATGTGAPKGKDT